MRRSPSTHKRHRSHSHVRARVFFYAVLALYFAFIFTLFLQFEGLISLRAIASAPLSNQFYPILSSPGVEVYRRDYEAGSPDFVTAVDLDQATLRNLTGTVNGELIGRKQMNRFWQDAVNQNSSEFATQVVINGTFFGNDDRPSTDIAFGLKAQNRLITYGYGLNEYPGQNKTFAFDSFAASAEIQSYRNEIFESAIPDIVGALAPKADKSATRRLGRTFVGVQDRDVASRTVLFFSSAAATQAHAETVLQQFGATAVAMLDGGGSTGLMVGGTALINTDRTLPHAIAVYTGKPKGNILAFNGLCLSANEVRIREGGSTEVVPIGATALYTTPCTSNVAQRWRLQNGALQGSGDQCLQSGVEDAIGRTPVRLGSCLAAITQRWRFEQGRFQTAGKCLEAVGQSVATEAEVWLRPCQQRAAQQWQRFD